MEQVADLADKYSFAEGPCQPHPEPGPAERQAGGPVAIWQALGKIGFADANAGLIGDIIACPGLDYFARWPMRCSSRSRRRSAAFCRHRAGP